MIPGIVAGKPVEGGGDPHWANVKLLSSFEGEDSSTSFVDLKGGGTLTGGGGAQISTAVFPDGALLLNGTSSGSRVTSSKSSAVGTGAFTWEAYIRPTSAVVGRVLSAQLLSSPNAVLAMRVNDTGSVQWIIRSASNTGTDVSASSTGLVEMDGSEEYHLCMERNSSGVMRMYLDGSVVIGPTNISTNPDNGRVFFVGAFSDTQERFEGNIRWVRATEGVARYNGPFVPPSIPFPAS